MNTFQECCWWLAFIVISIIAQALVPGLDALVVGVLLLLQERDYKMLGWLLPEILVVTALGFFVTELTGGPLAILIQGFWWLASLFSNTNSLVGGVGWNLMPRFNSSQDTAVWLEVFPQMVKNRLFYTVLALMLAAATVWVYHLKRKGVLQNGRKFLGRRKDTL